jgi:DNA-binding response OmpR family regulator
MAKILLVDDDPLLVRMYQIKFELDGNEVSTCGDGEEALEKLKSYTPDIVLLDIMMPKKDGLVTLEEIKENPETKKLPVIMLTNVSSSEADSQKGLELGAVAYLVKADYTPTEVVQKVKEILGAYTKDLPKVKVAIKK